MVDEKSWALVTGASSGIGRAFCDVLAERGWSLLLVARREERLAAAKAELAARFPIAVETVRADLADPREREPVLAALERLPIRFLINNAGTQARGLFDEVPFARSQQLIDLNVSALASLSHAGIVRFKRLGGRCHLLNVGSVNSFIATGRSATYSASKAFVKSFSVALAEELRGTPISCTCFCPGGTESEILEQDGMRMKPGRERLLMPAQTAARLGIAAALAGETVAVPGLSNKVSALLSRLMPERAATRIASRLQQGVMERAR